MKLYIGGGALNKKLLDKFCDLVEEDRKKCDLLVIIPTATNDNNILNRNNEYYHHQFKKFKNIYILHTRDKMEANKEEFCQILDICDGIWICGGKQKLLAESYLNTLVAFKLKNSHVYIGGTSAGAAIMASEMIKYSNPIPCMGIGFNLLKNSIIDQHFLKRNRLQRLITAVRGSKNNCIGIGIDENTVLCINNDIFYIIGTSYAVLVHQNNNINILQPNIKYLVSQLYENKYIDIE